MRRISILAIILLASAIIARADSMDLDVSAQPKKLQNKVVGKQEEELNKASEWAYTITIGNKTFKPLTGLEVKYMVFYKHEELGVKGPGQKMHSTGSFTVDSIAPNNTASNDTKPVELKQSQLLGSGGDYMYYANGAKSKVSDGLTGVWIRIYQNGRMLTEFAKPSNLTTKEQWDEGKGDN